MRRIIAALLFCLAAAAPAYADPSNNVSGTEGVCDPRTNLGANCIRPNADGSVNISGSITASNPSVGTNGSAAPTSSTQIGANIGGNLTGLIACNSSVVYDASTNGSTQLVALASSQVIRICGYTIFAAGTVNVELDYGTGTACATGNNKITPAFQLTAQTGIVDGSPYYRGANAIASNELCLKTSAGVAVQAIVYYTQF